MSLATDSSIPSSMEHLPDLSRSHHFLGLCPFSHWQAVISQSYFQNETMFLKLHERKAMLMSVT